MKSNIPSNLKNICQFERRDVISQICFTATRLHKGNQRYLVAFFTPGQAIGADRAEIGAAKVKPATATCHGVGRKSEDGSKHGIAVTRSRVNPKS